MTTSVRSSIYDTPIENEEVVSTEIPAEYSMEFPVEFKWFPLNFLAVICVILVQFPLVIQLNK